MCINQNTINGRSVSEFQEVMMCVMNSNNIFFALHAQENQKRQPVKNVLELRQLRLAAAQDALNTLMIKASVEGQHVDMKTVKLRAEITRAFMCVGAPLRYIDGLNNFLSRNGIEVGTTGTHLSEYIPDIAMGEKLEIQFEFLRTAIGGLVSFMNDGTLHHGSEVCCVVGRWIHCETFQPVQRLIHLGFLLSSMDHLAIVAEVLKALEKLEMDSYQNVTPILVVLNHDRVSANYAAVARLNDHHN